MSRINSVRAEDKMTLKISPLFQDHAVFQRDIMIPVWGDAGPEHQVRCTFGHTVSMTVSNSCGRFMLRLPCRGAGGPFEIVFEDLQSGEKISFSDIWVGEVYLVSGQSNMEFPLKGLDDFEKIRNAGRLDNPDVRYFNVPVAAGPAPAGDTGGHWQEAAGNATGDFSGVGFLFAEKIAARNGLKVGVIDASRGGTGIESWMSREALLKNPLLTDKVLEFDRLSYSTDIYEKLPPGRLLPEPDELILNMLSEHRAELPANKGLELGFAEPEFDDRHWRTVELPDSWNLAGYNHAGIFWYRITIDLPQEAAGRELELSLGAVDKGDITYFNGKEIGRTGDGIDMSYWNHPRVYKVCGELVRAGCNTIAVRAASLFAIATQGGLTGPAEMMFARVGDLKIPLDVEWRCHMEYNAGNKLSEALVMSGPGEPHSQHILFDNMIAPLIPYAIRGVLWYQGECNAISQAAGYCDLLQGLIRDWKYRWGQVKMDFIVIQLPGYQAKRLVSSHSQWALLREAQMQCGEPLVVTCDAGAENDLHPRDKSIVAIRAADIADALLNGREPVYSPQLLSVTLDRLKIQVKFDTYGSKLEFRGDPDGFAVGEKNTLYRAKAVIISDDTVELSHPNLKDPEIIYYGWSNFPTGNLYNTEGLPAAPFRYCLVP